ncbi:Acylphosphatase [Vanrija pseudolonga]|uniref:acylphosphatase n=1 Tax=Vanrija pseudolonga TaxID=143232 RepID=A0AAF0YBM5_9TREE|nr:Acylphosphatase [Vanrija pseudolonga]
MPHDTMELITFKVTGVVQGVSFRYYTQREALSLGLRGWCHNHPDESVEGVAVGDKDEIAQFTKYLHRGPKYAQVAHVDVVKVAQPSEAQIAEAMGEGSGDRQFEIRRWRG